MSVKQRILIVDDTVANIKVLSDLLRTHYSVSIATNGLEALEIADSENRPDLILLDIMMPGMDGYEVCIKLKENTTTKHIPVLFVSAKSEDEDETKGLALGAVDYITKPYSPAKILSRIKTHLELKTARENLVKQNEILRENMKLKEDVELMTRHDLKSPLMITCNYPELLKGYSNITDDQKEMLDEIIFASNRMLEMVDSSLDLYKMERGLYKLNVNSVDILSTFRQLKLEIMRLANKKNISLVTKLQDKPISEDDFLYVAGEKLLLFSLFSNLFKNAVEASPENETVLIQIKDQVSQLEIQINNKGAVPQEIHDNFFDKYSTSGKHKGTGLGTYSAMLMVKTLNGKITMETPDDFSTLITVILPKLKQDFKEQLNE